ncbi:hypothetical protein HN385_07575 [archaeon]|jgi:methenyltetrahydromethanopterin cyclohydrolase|nr:hypothetical protein [archaeon]MBT4207439.1 hypothetical protein [Candidatus Woesearchaeota archaeon]MBT4732233.1 hypothetical protein [Candidatus Woesearchaeota archaeon]MBT5758862.1 hypothetical protein [Candidatus Neomarinimicrobiota bacterium]MBT7557264.1 hypothetical protein [Candidatus Woesearchaeota archaeon]
MKITKTQLREIIKEEIQLLTERSLSGEMEELKLYIDNDSRLYNGTYIPILKNLSKKKQKGKYNSSLAMKGFVYLVNDGAKKYVKEFGGNDRDIFPKRQRIMLAKDYVDEFEQIFKNQEYDFMKTEK